jgi:hypothetical protein
MAAFVYQGQDPYSTAKKKKNKKTKGGTSGKNPQPVYYNPYDDYNYAAPMPVYSYGAPVTQVDPSMFTSLTAPVTENIPVVAQSPAFQGGPQVIQQGVPDVPFSTQVDQKGDGPTVVYGDDVPYMMSNLPQAAPGKVITVGNPRAPSGASTNPEFNYNKAYEQYVQNAATPGSGGSTVIYAPAEGGKGYYEGWDGKPIEYKGLNQYGQPMGTQGPMVGGRGGAKHTSRFIHGGTRTRQLTPQEYAEYHGEKKAEKYNSVYKTGKSTAPKAYGDPWHPNKGKQKVGVGTTVKEATDNLKTKTNKDKNKVETSAPMAPTQPMGLIHWRV